jgi:hypothetical protein
MANALAIAGVTAILRDLLNDGLINQDLSRLGDFAVTALPPERLSHLDQTSPTNRLNMFLYRVTPNTGWTNTRLPSRSSSGDRLTNSYLALDLHYLLSAYGEVDLSAEILLGYGMQLLHETPVLPRNLIRQNLVSATLDGAILPTPFTLLDADALADQVEQIRISPHYIDTEEMSRLWSSLNAGVRPSALYKASVVLIESLSSTREAPPVGTRNLYVNQLRRPRIARILSNAKPSDVANPYEEGAVILHGHRIALEGSGLTSQVTEVRLGKRVLTSEVKLLKEGRIEFDLPADLWPGIHSVQIYHRLDKRAPSAGQIPMEISNSAAFALSPSLFLPQSTPPPPESVPVKLTTPDLALVPAGAKITGTVKIRFAHKLGVEQKTELLLNEVTTTPPANRSAYAYVAVASAPAGGATEVTELDFSIKDVERAIYLVRVRVEGAVSEIGIASDQNLPPEIKALADKNIYSTPVLDLSP